MATIAWHGYQPRMPAIAWLVVELLGNQLESFSLVPNSDQGKGTPVSPNTNALIHTHIVVMSYMRVKVSQISKLTV